VLLTWSDDAGRSWRPPLDPFVFSPDRRTTGPRPIPITGPILKLGGGDLACQFEVNKPYRDTGTWRHHARESFDGARTS